MTWRNDDDDVCLIPCDSFLVSYTRAKMEIEGKCFEDQDKTWISTRSPPLLCLNCLLRNRFGMEPFCWRHTYLHSIHPPNWKQLINNLFVTWNEQFKLHSYGLEQTTHHQQTVSNDHRTTTTTTTYKFWLIKFCVYKVPASSPHSLKC